MSDDLAVRVAALERQNARLSRSVVACALCAVALPVCAAFVPVRAPVADEVKASRFVLVDPAGTERGALEFASGTSRLVLRDLGGTERVLVGVEPNSAFALLRDDQGRLRIGMACDAFPHLMLHDAAQLPRFHASVGASGAPSLLFSDANGKFALGMGLDGEGRIWRKPESDGGRSVEVGVEQTGVDRKAPVIVPEETGPKKKDG